MAINIGQVNQLPVIERAFQGSMRKILYHFLFLFQVSPLGRWLKIEFRVIRLAGRVASLHSLLTAGNLVAAQAVNTTGDKPPEVVIVEFVRPHYAARGNPRPATCRR